MGGARWLTLIAVAALTALGLSQANMQVTREAPDWFQALSAGRVGSSSKLSAAVLAAKPYTPSAPPVPPCIPGPGRHPAG